MEFEPIGFVKNEVEYLPDKGWGEIISELVINDNYAAGLTGLDEFSHAIIIFFMHKASYTEEYHLERHPRRCLDYPKVGIFSQRSKDRPNPIGITSVQIIGLNENILTVKGLDAINGTPIIDIKPYYPCFDLIKDAKTPYWVDEMMKNYF